VYIAQNADDAVSQSTHLYQETIMRAYQLILGLLVGLILSPVTLKAQWEQVFQTPTTNSYIFALTLTDSDFFIGTDSDGIYRYDEITDMWVARNSGLTDVRVHSITASGTDLFAGTLGGVFRSTDRGDNWTPVNNGLTHLDVYPITVSGSTLIIGTGSGGAFRSTDRGANWTQINNGLTSQVVSDIVVKGTNLFAGTNGGVFVSANNGDSWTAVNTGLSNGLVTTLTANETHLFAGTFGGGVFRSTDNGANWEAVNSGLTDPGVLKLIMNGTTVFAGTEASGVFYSDDYGSSWTPINTGLTNLSILSLVFVGTDLFAGSSNAGGNGVWRRMSSDIVTSVEESFSDEIPSSFSLEQNYPNPFNPTTMIEFSIPTSSRVTVRIYNSLGQIMETLVNQDLPPGQHSVRWDATGYASDVYFYGIHAGSFSAMKKLVLLK